MRHLQRLQQNWDWRAAGNFICGGAGAGLAIFGAVCAPTALLVPLVGAGLALVGLGLFFVWLEIGRPLRALNVLMHLRTSWMSREALAAMVLFALGAALAVGLLPVAWPVAVAAAVFLYCQARLLGAARGIPAWRHPLTLPLVILTGLTEGLGLFWLLAAWAQPERRALAALALLLLARAGLWRLWRLRLALVAAQLALRAIDANGRLVGWTGTIAPMALITVAALVPPSSPMAAALAALAGLLAAGAGAAFKFMLVTRAAHQQGYSLPRMPVRGVPRTAPR